MPDDGLDANVLHIMPTPPKQRRSTLARPSPIVDAGQARPPLPGATGNPPTDGMRLAGGPISIARVATALGVAIGSAQLRVGLHRLTKEADRLAAGSDTLRLVAGELHALSPRVFGRQELEVAQAEAAIHVGGCAPAIAALLEPPPPFLTPAEQGLWSNRRLRLYVHAILRGHAVAPAVAGGLRRLGDRSAASFRAAPVLSGPAPAIASLASHCAKWLRPVARAFHRAAIEELRVRTRRVEGSATFSPAERERKYRPLARLKPIVVRVRAMRRVGPLDRGSFTVPGPQWNALADRIPADLQDTACAAFACALYFICRVQIAPRDFDCIRLGPWCADGESWLDLSVGVGHLSLDLVGLTGTSSRWPTELRQRAVLFIPVHETVLNCLRKLLDANPGAFDLAELLVTSASWMGEFERYLHSLAISSWQVTIERLLSAFPERIAARLGNEVAVDAALAFGGLCSRSLYHYANVRATRLQWAAREIDRLLGF